MTLLIQIKKKVKSSPHRCNRDLYVPGYNQVQVHNL